MTEYEITTLNTPNSKLAAKPLGYPVFFFLASSLSFLRWRTTRVR